MYNFEWKYRGTHTYICYVPNSYRYYITVGISRSYRHRNGCGLNAFEPAENNQQTTIKRNTQKRVSDMFYTGYMERVRMYMNVLLFCLGMCCMMYPRAQFLLIALLDFFRERICKKKKKRRKKCLP